MIAEPTVAEALAAWRARYPAGIAAQDGSFTLKLGPIALRLPNPGMLDLHDLHHVALDAPPSFLGEIQVGAFEVMTRVPTAYIGFYDYGAVLVGFLIMPLRMIAWLRAYRRCRTFYDQGPRYQAWLDRPMRELRAYLGVPNGPPG